MNPSDWHDISWPLTAGTTTWPGAPPVGLTERRSVAAGDSTTDTVLSIDVHAGTHVEGPRHHSADGATVDQLPLTSMVGAAVVVDVTDPEALTGPAAAALVPDGATRVLLRTSSSTLDPGADFDPTFPALDVEGARALAALPLQLLGIDYLSIQRFDASPETHAVLFRAGITILEGLRLARTPAGPYDLVCLPLALPGREAAPVRAFLAPAGTIETAA